MLFVALVVVLFVLGVLWLDEEFDTTALYLTVGLASALASTMFGPRWVPLVLGGVVFAAGVLRLWLRPSADPRHSLYRLVWLTFVGIGVAYAGAVAAVVAAIVFWVSLRTDFSPFPRLKKFSAAIGALAAAATVVFVGVALVKPLPPADDYFTVENFQASTDVRTIDCGRFFTGTCERRYAEVEKLRKKWQENPDEFYQRAPFLGDDATSGDECLGLVVAAARQRWEAQRDVDVLTAVVSIAGPLGAAAASVEGFADGPVGLGEQLSDRYRCLNLD